MTVHVTRLTGGLFRLHLIQQQKKQKRLLMGWLRPVRCPRCRVPTTQVQETGLKRKCLSCGTTFTKAESRRAA